ncbi:MAG: hypothetical protein IT286_03480 [Proteobacteria bacterium]|nr:hypothetical protein [Pseudomonadota bacterium]
MRTFSSISVLLLILTLSGCYLNKAGGGGSVPEDVSFETDIVAIMTDKCATSGCHTGSTPQGSLNLNIEDSDANTLYSTITGQIDLGEPASSVLLAKATNVTQHTGGEIFNTSSREYKTILKWIEDGAFNDNCDGIAHSFATDVTPIFTQCTTAGCHDVTVPVLSVDAFQNIESANAVNTENPASSTLLRMPLGVVEHTGGMIFPSRDDADYKTIFCWIKEDNAADN